MSVATDSMGLPFNSSSTMSTLPVPGVVPVPNIQTSPSFGNVMGALRLQQPGQQFLNQGVQALTPSSGISPETQQAIDVINKQRDYYASLGQSAAQGLATQRGIAGSSTEQFGVQNALTQTNNAALGQIQGLLSNDVQNKAALQLAQGQLLGGYGTNLNQLQAGLSGLGGQLTSDEIASQRNMALSQQALGLQAMLGQQGIDLGYANINSAQSIASQQARNALIGSVGQMLTPYLFGGGGGGGMLGGLFGGGGGSLTGTAYGGAGSPASSLFPGGLGQVGTGTSGFSFGMPNLALGAGGMIAGQNMFGNNMYSNIGGVAGGIGGSMFGPIGSGIGSFLGEGLGNVYGNLNNTAKSLINPFANPSATLNTIGSGISKVGKSISHAVGSPF